MPTIEEIRSQYPQYGDMSDGQLATALHQKYYSDMPEEEFRSKIGMAPAGPMGPPAPDTSFTGRVKQDTNTRLNNMQGQANQYVAGNQSMPSTMLQNASEAVMFGNDVLGEALKSTGSGISSITPQPVKQATANVLDYIGNSGPVRAASNLVTNNESLARDSIAAYNSFAQNHPELAGDIRATVGIGSAVGPFVPVKGASLAGTAVDAVKGEPLLKEGIELPASRRELVTQNAKQEVTRSQAKKAAAQAQYQSQANITLSPDEAQKFSQSLSDLAPKSDLAKRSWSRSAAAKYAGDIQESLDVENPDFQGLLETRKDINSDMKAMYKANNEAEAQKLQRVKDALDEVMTRSDTPQWQMANHLWQQSAILSDTEDWVSFAQGKMQPANSLDTKINNYLNSNASRGLSKQERSALEEVVRNSSMDKLKRGVASGLTKFAAGAAGGPAGYLIGHYGSEFAKDSAMASKLAKLDAFRDMIEARKPPVKASAITDSVDTQPMNIAQKLKANAK